MSDSDDDDDDDGKAVYEAARDGDEAELRRLIKRGGSVNWHNPNVDGDTALMMASTFECEGCVRLLIKSGANVNDTNDDGWSALHYAAHKGHLAIAKRLLEGGADLTLRNNQGNTALDNAREWSWSREVVALLSEPRYADGDRTECESNVDLNANRMRNRLRTE